MRDLAIHVEGLGKLYHIGRMQQHHDTLRDAIVSTFRRSNVPRTNERIWALKDVSLEVACGEVVGIIGRNGAGKSTLLKILSRITEPTEGRAEIHGRVGSLLEVGTGFHPELTGRENIYLNGAILGMRRTEIARRFDEIVAFAEIEKFIDTPVKRYSSGMYVRLAFAVAAHLEPEILLVDEVLAVGDMAFQQKCLGKMGEVATGGRTVLFVSHNMAAVRSLCSRCLLLEAGSVSHDASVDTCVKAYTVGKDSGRQSYWLRDQEAKTPLSVQKVTATLHGRQPHLKLMTDIELESRGYHRPAFTAIDISDSVNSPLMQVLPTVQPFIEYTSGLHSIRLVIELPPLIPGSYTLSVWVGSHNTETLDFVGSCVAFVITESPTAGRSFPHTIEHGHIVPRTEMEYTSPSSNSLVVKP
jgi:lipopolysaccharide transport system ATP-binding protein